MGVEVEHRLSGSASVDFGSHGRWSFFPLQFVLHSSCNQRFWGQGLGSVWSCFFLTYLFAALFPLAGFGERTGNFVVA